MDGPTPKLPNPGGPSDPIGPSPAEVQAALLADLAWGPLDGDGAAAFLKTTRAGFDRLAPSIPRKKKRGLGYRYLRSDLLAWLCSDDEGDDPGRQRRQRDGNAGSVGVSRGRKKGGRGTVRRLVEP